MPLVIERVERNCHQFWLKTCGFNTLARGEGYAQLDTPWNAFSQDDVLVCTLWTDEIVECFDALAERTRRFVKIGGKAKSWKGPAVKHGKDADDNLSRASKDRLRVVGYEAKPNFNKRDPDARSVSHFYLDRAHELKRMFDWSDGDMLERLKVERAFELLNRKKTEYTGYIFELVPPLGDFPGRVESADIGVQAEADGMTVKYVDTADLDDGDDAALFDLDESEKASADEYAYRCVPILIAHVLAQRDGKMSRMTYKDLAGMLDRRDKHGRPWARGLGHVLGKVTSMVDNLQMGWAEEIPYLTTIVVAGSGAEKGLPGIGIKGKWSGYDALSIADKHARIGYEYKKILAFGSRWNEVLVMLGLPPLAVPSGPENAGGRGGWGGGESEEHKALKLFVRHNPHLVGADSSFDAMNEFVLRSNDEIDVFFKSPALWIGVEVKSRVSDGIDRDYERGLYQVVKYFAVLAAQSKVDHPDNPPAVRVFLVLESELPPQYVEVAKRLGIEVLDRVVPSYC